MHTSWSNSGRKNPIVGMSYRDHWCCMIGAQVPEIQRDELSD